MLIQPVIFKQLVYIYIYVEFSLGLGACNKSSLDQPLLLHNIYDIYWYKYDD